jgi:hypothetical protein
MAAHAVGVVGVFIEVDISSTRIMTVPRREAVPDDPTVTELIPKIRMK